MELSEFTEALTFSSSPSPKEAKSLPESSDTLEVFHNHCRSHRGKGSKGTAENQRHFFFSGLFLRAALQNVESCEGSGFPKHVVENMKSKQVEKPFLECCDHDSMQVLGHFPTICSLC